MSDPVGERVARTESVTLFSTIKDSSVLSQLGNTIRMQRMARTTSFAIPIGQLSAQGSSTFP